MYDVSGQAGSSLGAALGVGIRSTAAERRERRKRELSAPETNLLHDFSFPTVCSRVKVSRDGRYVFASGTYPPQIHVYDTQELSLKFKRHVSSEIVEFQVLEDDWRKFALLTADRYIDLHSQHGSHYSIRIPRFGRDLMLHRGTCDLYACGAGADVWRLNLERGQFLAPVPTCSGLGGGNNVCGINPYSSLLAFGGEIGSLDIWDPRCVGASSNPAGTLNVESILKSHLWSHSLQLTSGVEVTALRFDDNSGLNMIVGTSTGHSLLFDMRSSRPIHVRDQGYGVPIRSLKLHEDGQHCLSADAKCVKIWNRFSGTNVAAVEPDADINHLCVFGSTGIFCAAVEDSRVRSFYVPSLGPAPKWCSFLDSFTEELEDVASNGMIDKYEASSHVQGTHDSVEIYQNYKFVSQKDLEGLGLGHLIGSNMLKPYMHGYFIDMKLYRRAIDVSAPFAYEQYKKDRAKEKIAAEREGRIGKVRKRGILASAKVNQQLIHQLTQGDPVANRTKAKQSSLSSVVDDPRFSALFQNPDFALDESSERYQHLHPSGVRSARTSGRDSPSHEEDSSVHDFMEDFERVSENVNGETNVQRKNGDTHGHSSDSESDFASSVDDSEPEQEKPRPRRVPHMFKLRKSAEILGSSSKSNARHQVQKVAIRDIHKNLPLQDRVRLYSRMN